MYIEVARLVISFLTLIAIPISVTIAYRNLKSSQSKNKLDNDYRYDKEIVDQCILSLSRAYDILDIQKEDNIPKFDRLSWLTSARMLLRYERLRAEVKTELYQTICDEHEEYWRHKFYQVLDSEKITIDYFLPTNDIMDSNNISGISALIIFRFSKWKKGSIDPIEGFDFERAILEDHVLLGHNGLKQYLRSYSQYKKLIDLT